MMKFLFLILLFLSSIQTAVAGKRATPLTPKAALIIQMKNNRINHTTSYRDSLLAIACQHYCRYYQYIQGGSYDTLLFSSPKITNGLLGTLQEHRFTSVTVVYPMGTITSHNRIITDSHNRRRVASIDGYLNLKVVYSFYTLTNGQWHLTLSDTIVEPADPDWGSRVGYLRKYAERDATPEPYQYVIRRAINKMFTQLPPLKTKHIIPQATLPVRIFITPNVYQQERNTILSRIRHIVSLASYSLVEQFGIGLTVIEIDTVTYQKAPSAMLRDAIGWLSNRYPHTDDTLMIIFHNQLTADEYFTTRKHKNIGMSQLGKNRIVINLLPTIHRQDILHDSFDDGLVLLHEIGHSFGALHVSDFNAVMAHTLNWVSSDRFDPVNYRIVQAALTKELTFDDLGTYLHFVSQTIQESSYKLTDYPAFFYSTLTSGRNRLFAQRLRAAIDRKSYIRAADAYGLFIHGRRQKAAALFRTLIYKDPQQASLYYYLSRTGKGTEADNARRVAIQMGYQQAIETADTPLLKR